MTAVIDPADARRSASHMIRSSITLSLTGLHVGWMTNASTPRTFSLISQNDSPSEKRVRRIFASGVSRYAAMAVARSGFAFPENRQTFLNNTKPSQPSLAGDARDAAVS